MQDPERYYRSTGTVPLAGLAIMFGAGCFTALVLSFVYAFIDLKSPDVRLNFIATGGYAAGLGGVMHWAARVGAVRSKFLAQVMAAGVGLIGLYFAWIWFVWILSGWAPQAIILDLRALWQTIQFLAVAGVWEINGRKPEAWELYAAWVVETLIIVLTPVALVVGNRPPYCEGCRCWTRLLADRIFVRSTEQSELRQRLEEEQYAALAGLVDNVDGSDCLQLGLHQCPKCEDSDYLTVSHVAVTQKGKETRVKTTEFVKRLHVPREVAEQIKAIPASQKPDFGLPDQPSEAPASTPEK